MDDCGRATARHCPAAIIHDREVCYGLPQLPDQRISLGSIYAIIALGYTMVYGIAKMLNFAHGDVIMVGAYICLFSMNGLSSLFAPAAWPR